MMANNYLISLTDKEKNNLQALLCDVGKFRIFMHTYLIRQDILEIIKNIFVTRYDISERRY